MAVEEWVNGKNPDFFSSGLMALEHRWSKCIKSKKKGRISTGNKLGWLLIDTASYQYKTYVFVFYYALEFMISKVFNTY